MLAGSCRSVRRGRGSEFSEFREYGGLDDARSIDWNVSARMTRPFVKVYREERELPVAILVDTSASMAAFEPARSCRDTAGEAAALLAWAADANGDRSSLWFFADEASLAVPEGRGRAHRLAILEALAAMPAPLPAGDPGPAIRMAARRLRQRGLIIVLSDFLTGDWASAARAARSRHELILARIIHTCMGSGLGLATGPGKLPERGILNLRDPESGRSLVADFGSRAFKAAYGVWASAVSASFNRQSALVGARRLELREDGDVLGDLVAFFSRRAGART
jgi:uncharacterized protein (DUF58 family)